MSGSGDATGGLGSDDDSSDEGSGDPSAGEDPRSVITDEWGGESSEDSGDDFGDDSGDSPIKFDIAPPPEDLESIPCGVDILFVIDNSGSMFKHKTNIVTAFDSFIGEMLEALAPATPVHIAVTRATGFYAPGNGSGWSDPSCQFGYLDGFWNPPTLIETDVNGQQGRLYEHEDKRYFEYAIGDDTTELASWFEGTVAGAIELDQSSNTESVVAAAAYPFHPVNAEYNAGFLREKAVLVLFLLSDAPDASPPDITTAEYIQMVSDAKAGCGDGCVLPTGIVQGACYANENNTNSRLTDFMSGFGSPPAAIDFFYLNEAPESFTSVFGKTLAQTIAYTCDNIVPAD